MSGQPYCPRTACEEILSGPQKEKNNMDQYHVCLAGVVGAAHDKNHNQFSARGGKKVAHHYCKLSFLCLNNAGEYL